MRIATWGLSRAGQLAAAVFLMLVVPPKLLHAQVNVGVVGGGALGITTEAIGGFEDTKFGGGPVSGVSVGFRFDNGLAIEVTAERFGLRLREDSDDFGTLQVSPVLVLLKYQGRPARGAGLAPHAQFGIGVARGARFENGPAIASMERAFPGARLVVETDRNPFVFELGAGFDYLITRYVSITGDFRLIGLNVGTSWKAVGRRTVAVDGIEKFFASNGQTVFGVKVWIG